MNSYFGEQELKTENNYIYHINQCVYIHFSKKLYLLSVQKANLGLFFLFTPARLC